MTKLSMQCNCLATTTNNKCKLPFKFIIRDKKYCYIHAKIFLGNAALYIQKIYIGIKTRRKLRNIYNHLPDDIQRKILWYIRETHYIEQYHHKPIQKILHNKTHLLTNNQYFIHYFIIPSNMAPSVNSIITYYKELTKLYNLYSKYITITSKEWDLCLFTGIARNLRHLNWAIENNLFHFHEIDPAVITEIRRLFQISISKYAKKYRKIYNLI